MTGQNSRDSSSPRRTLAVVLSLLFVTAMIMGPGPGLYLVNPDRADPEAIFTAAGVPVLYLWALFWFIVQATVIFGLLLLGRQLQLGGLYTVGVMAALVLALYQQYLIRGREPGPCLQAFKNNGWFGAAVFAGLSGRYLVNSGQ